MYVFCQCLSSLGSDKAGLFLLYFFKQNYLPKFFILVNLNPYDSDSQSLLRGPLVVPDISWSGPRIPMQINILCFVDHQIIPSGRWSAQQKSLGTTALW